MAGRTLADDLGLAPANDASTGTLEGDLASGHAVTQAPDPVHLRPMQVQTVTPAAGASALKHGPAAGIPPDAAMHDPAFSEAQANVNTQQSILSTSPHVRSFVGGSDDATVAATKNDWSAFARLGETAQDYWGRGGPFGDVASVFQESQRLAGQGGVDAAIAAQHGDILGQVKGLGESLLGGFGTIFSPFAAVTEPGARVLNAAPSSTYSRVLAARGQQQRPEQTPEDKAAQSEFAANLLYSVLPGPKVFFRKEPVLPGEAGPPLGGAPHPTAPPSYTPEGFVADPNGARATFATARDAAKYNLQTSGGGAAAEMSHTYVENPNGTYSLQQRRPLAGPGGTPESDAFHAQQADVAAAKVEDAQTQIAAVGTHSDLPSVTADFLENHTPVGGQSAWVDPQALAQVYATGERPFEAHASAIAQAIQAGREVQLPLSDYLAESAGQPWAADLNKATRFTPDGVSQEEAKGLSTAFEPTAEATPKPVEVPADLTEHGPAIQSIAARASASVDQIFREQFLTQLFTDPKALGMSKDQFERYGNALEEAKAAVRDRVLERTYNQLRRERTSEWKKQVEALQPHFARDLENHPDVKAARFLAEKGYKLDRGMVEGAFPGSAARLPKNILTSKGGVNPDDVADLLGYQSGATMVSNLADLADGMELAKVKTLSEYIRKMSTDAAESQARTNLGYDITPEGLLAAAREAATESPIDTYLSKELQALSKPSNQPFSKADMKAEAERQFNDLTVAKAANPKEFERGMFSNGNKIEAKLLAEDPVRAFKLRQNQYLNYLQLQMSHQLVKQLAKANKAISTVARKPISASMDQNARNHLRAIAQQLGFNVRTKKFEGVQEALKGESLEAYGNKLLARGQPVFLADIPPPPGGSNSGVTDIPSMKVSEFYDVWGMWRSIAELGRQEMTATVEGRRVMLKDLGDEVKANADAVGRVWTAGQAQLAQGKVRLSRIFTPAQSKLLLAKIMQLPGNVGRTLGAAVTRTETPLFWLDRELNGPLMKSVINPINDGDYFKAGKITELGDAWREFMATQPKGWVDSIDNLVDIPELTYNRSLDNEPVPWMRDRGNVIRAALHFGSEENFKKLTDGFGWDPATVEAAVNRTLSPADWKYVQFLWDRAHALWPETQELYRDTVGLAPREVKGRDFTTPDGTQMTGRYWHLDYDWNAVGEVEDGQGGTVDVHDPMAFGQSELFGNQYRPATPPNGSTKARTSFEGPLNLDHSTLHREFEQVIHDLAYRKALIQASRVLRQPAVRNAIREALGPEYYAATQQWLKDIAHQSVYDQTALKGLAGILRGFRRNFTIVQVGWNIVTLGRHGGIAAMHMMGEGGLHNFGALFDIMRDNDHWTDFIDSKSDEVKNTLQNLDRDVREVMLQTFRKKGFVEYNAMSMFGIVKRAEAQVTWLAKYRQYFEHEHMDEEDAIKLANKAVRDTQGSGTTANTAALARGDGSLGSEALKLTQMFTSFENTTTNRMWTVARTLERGVKRILGFRDGGWSGARRDFTKAFNYLLSFLVLPSLLLTGVDEITGKHGQKFMERFWEHLFQGSLGGSVPMGNTFASLPRIIKGDTQSDPITEALKGAALTVAAPFGVHDARWVQHAIETAGYITGRPVKPLSRAGQFWWDKNHGRVPDDSPWTTAKGTLLGPSSITETPAPRSRSRGRGGRR